MQTEILQSTGKYSLLRSVRSAPMSLAKMALWVGETTSWAAIVKAHPSLLLAKYVALDWESDGTFVPVRTPKENRKHCLPVGLGLSWRNSDGSPEGIYIDWKSLGSSKRKTILKNIATLPAQLIGHNLMFDGSIILRDLGYWPDNLYWDTYSLFKHLAGEGFPGQGWSLKSAMVEFLGWPESNIGPVEDWLFTNGYWTGTNSEQGSLIAGVGNVKADLSYMGEVPSDILGPYCVLDCWATLEFFEKVLLPVAENTAGPAYLEYWRHFRELMIRCSEAYLTGITVDKAALATYSCQLQQDMHALKRSFLTHPKVAPCIAEYNAKVLGSHMAKEPPRVKADGSPSATWQKWWERACEKETTNFFKVTSDKNLRWLFFEKLGHTTSKTTEGGLASIDKNVLPSLGEPGKILAAYNLLSTELTNFVLPYLEEHIVTTAGVSRIHPRYMVPGPITGRLACRDPNIQNVPTSRQFLEAIKPTLGTVWVDADYAQLENIVGTELSKDASLWKLYGPGAAPNDAHLYTGWGLPVIGDAIRKYYDRDNPTEDSIALAKKNCKKERKIAKTINYAVSYGAAAGKIQQTLALEGVDLDRETVVAMLASYWETFNGVKVYEKSLIKEWKMRGGWVRNGVGRPVCVHVDSLKDIYNRQVQSTGHDLLVIYVARLSWWLRENYPMARLVIPDWHDQVTVECTPELAEEIRSYMEGPLMDEVNVLIGGEIPLRMEADLCESLADSKLEEAS